MPPDPVFGAWSNHLYLFAVLSYFVAMLGYGAEHAFGRSGRVARVAARPAPRRVLVGAGGPPTDDAPPPAPPARRFRHRDGSGPAGALGVAAIAFTVLGWLLHVGSVTTRGLAAHRVPWGNMYEFSSMVALIAVTAFLVLLTRSRVRYLGGFVLLPVVLYMGLAGTVLYSKAEPLVPALNSYWIKIHVVAAISSSGIFLVGGVVSALYLVRERWERRLAARAGSASGAAGAAALMELRAARSVVGRLPPAATLDRVAYRINAFAFPIWTFAIIAGAIWAEAAWGRYWGWDPKETWSFITWVIYACYLHARATAGWKGRRAALLALLAFSALTIDYYVVNIFIVGLHSYAGV